jgi:hypothetical protein
MMMMSRMGINYGYESYDDDGKTEQLDASTDAFGAMVRVTGMAVPDNLPVPSFSQGTTAQRMACTPDALRLCTAFILNAGEITIFLKKRLPSSCGACRTVLEATMNQPSSVSDGTGAGNAPPDSDR